MSAVRRRFVTRNMSHGCGEYSVDGFFEGRSPSARELYDALVRVIAELGPFEQVPTKTRIAFMVRVRFAAVNRVRRDGLACHVWLKRRSIRLDSRRSSCSAATTGSIISSSGPRKTSMTSSDAGCARPMRWDARRTSRGSRHGSRDGERCHQGCRLRELGGGTERVSRHASEMPA